VKGPSTLTARNVRL